MKLNNEKPRKLTENEMRNLMRQLAEDWGKNRNGTGKRIQLANWTVNQGKGIQLEQNRIHPTPLSWDIFARYMVCLVGVSYNVTLWQAKKELRLYEAWAIKGPRFQGQLSKKVITEDR